MHYRDHSPFMSLAAFLGLCALVIVPVCYVKYSAATGGNVRSAEAELKQWAAKLDIEISGRAGPARRQQSNHRRIRSHDDTLRSQLPASKAIAATARNRWIAARVNEQGWQSSTCDVEEAQWSQSVRGRRVR